MLEAEKIKKFTVIREDDRQPPRHKYGKMSGFAHCSCCCFPRDSLVVGMAEKKTARLRNNRKTVEMRTIEEKDDEAPGTAGGKKKETTMRTKKRGGATTRSRGSSFPVQVVQNCTEFVQWACGFGIDGLATLFRNELASARPPTKPMPSFEANMDKNRYPDVFCLEETRVKLKIEAPGETDYIHANHVRFQGMDRAYICTQGPMETTMGDFWRMMWQEESPTVVNLTSNMEDGRQKCAQYWSTEVGKAMQVGKFTVTTKKREQNDNTGGLITYTIEVLPDGCSNALVVRLIHCSQWPDGNAMYSTRAALRLIKQIHAADPVAKGPVVVHCSAGIGRTGTMVLIDCLLYRLFTQVVPHNLQEMFIQLREQRASSIQREVQFIFLVVACVDYVGLTLRNINRKFEEAADELERKFLDKYVIKPK